MTEASLRAIVQGLNDAGVRYLIVGGLAVNTHGYQRYTGDLDLLIHLDRDNLLAGLKTLAALGYTPTVPIVLEEFADENKRRDWIENKHMKVLGLRSDRHRETSVDVFVNDPLGFEEAYKRVHYARFPDGLSLPFCAYQDLVTLKTIAGRPQDLADLHELRIARGEA